jgi:hypothetical protein
MLSNGIHIGRLGGVRLTGGGGGVDPDAAALIALMSVAPDATRQGHINTLVTALKAGGVWTLLDELWVMAAHDAQAAGLGWKRYKNLTAVSSPTFTADRGYAGNGTTSYLNTGFVPSTDGVQYTLNDASFGVYSRTDTSANVRDMGTRIASSNAQSNIMARWNDNRAYGKNNTNPPASYVGFSVAASTGLFVARRTSATTDTGWRNGVKLVTETRTSNALSTFSFFICGMNNGGMISTPTTRQYAAAFVGASMSEAQQLSLYNALQAYMTAVGAQV